MAGPSVTIELSANEAKVLMSIQKLIDKNRELEKSLEEAGKKGKKAGQDVDKSASGANDIIGKAKSSVMAWATSFGAVSTAVAFVTATIGKMNESLQKAKELTERLKNDRANLASVATSVDDYAKLEQRSNAAAIQYGIDPDLARQMMFSARSSGYEASFETAARYGAFFDPNAVSNTADKLPQIFRGQVDAAQSLNATYAAAQASNLNFAQIAEAAPKAAEGGAMIGASPQETLGVSSVLAAQFGRGSTAADRMSAFGTKMALEDGFQGLGFIESVRKLQAMSPEERSGILGNSQELNVAYQKLTENLDTIVERVGQVDQAIRTTGTDQSMIAQMENVYFSNSRNRALFERDRQRIASELGGEGLDSEYALNAEASMFESRQQQQRSLGRVGRGVADLFGGAGSYWTPATGAVGQEFGGCVGRYDSSVQGAEFVEQIVSRLIERAGNGSNMAQPDVDR